MNVGISVLKLFFVTEMGKKSVKSLANLFVCFCIVLLNIFIFSLLRENSDQGLSFKDIYNGTEK